jgi:hypothetical protein
MALFDHLGVKGLKKALTRVSGAKGEFFFMKKTKGRKSHVWLPLNVVICLVNG